MSQVVDRVGPPTVLVNNAVDPVVLRRDGSVATTDADQWRATLDIVLVAAATMCRLVIPHMVDAGRGSIVNVSSRASARGTPGGLGLLLGQGRTRGPGSFDHRRLRPPAGVRCNVVRPGYILHGDRDRDMAPERRQRYEAMHLTRLPTAEDVAAAVVFLAGPDSEVITGVTLPVDGGSSAVRAHDVGLSTSIVGIDHHGGVRFGIITPVLTLSRIHNEWEESGTIADAAALVRAADRLGYHHVTCAEHVGVPSAQAAARGGRYWAALPTLGYFAGMTERVRLLTHQIVLGYHHPLAILKNYSSLDRLSGGRLILGMGVGSLREEFDALGASFGDRGRRADDAIAALREGFGVLTPAHEGPYYRYGGLVLDPTSVQSRVRFGSAAGRGSRWSGP